MLAAEYIELGDIQPCPGRHNLEVEETVVQLVTWLLVDMLPNLKRTVFNIVSFMVQW